MTAAATWPVFQSKLVRRQEVAERTIAFHFEKPPGWTFKAGQFLDMTLLAPPETDAEGNKRGFSIASAPEEGTIIVASRMRDTAFKRVLQTMPFGTLVTIEGPFGNLTLHHNAARAAVILAGGIGITPFRSILIDAARRRLPQRIFVLSRHAKDAASPIYLHRGAAGDGEWPAGTVGAPDCPDRAHRNHRRHADRRADVRAERPQHRDGQCQP
jgi:ferredoxin-NADP reductase